MRTVRAAGITAVPHSPRATAEPVASGTIANPSAGPRDTLASCLAGSGHAACFTAAASSAASAPATSPVPSCSNAAGGASCFGRSRLEAIAAADLAAPSALAGTVSGTAVALSWTAPATGDPVTFYVIEAGSAPGLSNLASLSTGNTVTAFATTGVPAGVYYVRVRAASGAGAGPPSNEVVLHVGGSAGCGPLGTPTLSVVTNSGGTVGFSWTIPSGGPTAYILQAGSAPGLSNLANLDLRQASPTFTTTGVPFGTYYVRVLARRHDCARSAPSNEVVVNVGPPLPTGPTVTFEDHGGICYINPTVFVNGGPVWNFWDGSVFELSLPPGSHSYTLCEIIPQFSGPRRCLSTESFTLVPGEHKVVAFGGGYGC